MVGMYQMDIFGEASRTPEGFIEVDFLTGATTGGQPSASLARGLRFYSETALPQLCQRHGGAVSEFRELKARFWPEARFGRYEVIVEDQSGRLATTEYEGSSGKRVKFLDHLGRIRPR